MDMAIGYGMIAAALNPVERWAALRSYDPSYLAGWTVWVPVLAAVVIGMGLILAWRRYDARREIFEVFFRAAEHFELSVNERAVLTRIARMAGAKRLGGLYTIDVAFDDGVARLMQTRDIMAMTEEVRQRVSDIIDSLRTKFGFRTGDGGINLSRGDRGALVHRGTPPEVGATVIEIDNRDITLQFDTPVSLRVGEACVLRQVRGQVRWEFNVSITEPLEGLAVARLIGEPHTTNLRQFARAVTRRTARVARFPFRSEGGAGKLPQFITGTLAEIAGPGLLIKAPVQMETGDRLLVVLEVGAGRSFQGLGLIRRCSPGDDGLAEIAVEMVGMTEGEIAELVKETNAAARRNGAGGPERTAVSVGTA